MRSKKLRSVKKLVAFDDRVKKKKKNVISKGTFLEDYYFVTEPLASSLDLLRSDSSSLEYLSILHLL